MTIGAAPEPAVPVAAAATGDEADTDVRRLVQRSYEHYHRRLEAGPHGRHTRFMNFGYAGVAGSRDDNRFAIPRLLPNAEGARLVGEIIGPEPLDGRVVVDVGCGRGGALWLATGGAAPRLALGFDLSPAGARAAADALHDRPCATVGVADAEALPVASAVVDVVLNVESSLHYPHLERFHAEVARVLRAGGAFCYGDLFHVAAGDAYEQSLSAAGLQIEDQRDVTANVLRARRDRATRQRRALEKGYTDDAARFVAEPGTPFFDAMADGTLAYRLIRARRTDGPAGLPAADERLRIAARLAHELTGAFDGAG